MMLIMMREQEREYKGYEEQVEEEKSIEDDVS